VVIHRFRAQALLEFALVVVILFMLIFGILEVGRLLFVHASVITASREAVRYGSVAGRNDDGDLFYQDCAGIRDTARRFAFFQDLQDDDILIEYDTGPGTAVYDICDDLSDGVADGVDEGVIAAPNSRVLVTVTASFAPIVPIVPISASTIIYSSARTFVGLITLE
jgi:Flp pilus assembly protein TadG